MRCPICKSQCEEEKNCPECGFVYVDIAFVNKEDAEAWYNQVVIPFRKTYWLCKCREFVVDGNVLREYTGNSRKCVVPYGIEIIEPNTDESPGSIFTEDSDCVEEVFLPASVKEIGESAFSSQIGLKQVHLNQGLKTIRSDAFSECGITRIDLPDSVSKIEEGFCRCMAEIVVRKTNPFFIVDNDCLIEKRIGLLLHCWSKKDIIEIPKEVKRIGRFAFPFGENEKRIIVLPNGLESIGFCFGRGIDRICIPASVHEIEDGAFRWTKQVDLSKENPWFTIRDNALIDTRINKMVLLCDKEMPVYIVPNYIDSVATGAFTGFYGSVVISSNTTKLSSLVIYSLFGGVRRVFSDHKSFPSVWDNDCFFCHQPDLCWKNEWRMYKGSPEVILVENRKVSVSLVSCKYKKSSKYLGLEIRVFSGAQERIKVSLTNVSIDGRKGKYSYSSEVETWADDEVCRFALQANDFGGLDLSVAKRLMFRAIVFSVESGEIIGCGKEINYRIDSDGKQ